jgi:MarR family transcriptional regulator, 2-MHQ and catechol-resistance regulon repressor
MGTKYKGSSEEILSLNTYIKLVRAVDGLTSKINSSLIKNNLSESQFYVLDALFHLGPLAQKEISKKISCSDGNTTMIIDNLEKEGFVIRTRGTNDRRIYFVHLTKKGEKKIKSVIPVFVKNMIKLLGSLSSQEQEELQRITKKIGLSNSTVD